MSIDTPTQDSNIASLPAREPAAPEFRVHTYGKRWPVIWPPFKGAEDQISIKDIASHLAHITYFPESFAAPLTAAQYACELADALRKAGPLAQLHGLLANADEAFLGYTPPAARAAEKGMTMPPLVWDRRDELNQAMQLCIIEALGIPPVATLGRMISTQMHVAREQLDATLERDIGAWIFRPPHYTPAPLSRVIRPLRWDKALELYMQAYGELTALCGIRAGV